MDPIEFKSLLVFDTCSVLDALGVMDKASTKIVLVINDNSQLLGTLTDGDVRRGLIKGISLESPVNKVMKTDYNFVYLENVGRAENEIRDSSLNKLPVLDRDHRVVGLLVTSQSKAEIVHDNAIVIMAGGKGKRLWPYTKDCPKPMLLVDDKPILEILINQCKENGFKNIYLSVNYLKEVIIDYFGDGSRWGLNISYLIEDIPLGTAGSLKMLPKQIDKPFLVMNGDVLTKIELRKVLEFHQDHKADATICVRHHEVSVPFGVVETNGTRLSQFSEKPIYSYLVNAGVYVLNPSILDIIKYNHVVDMPDVLEKAKNYRLDVHVCPIHEYWIDVGVPETMKEANQTWKNAT